MPWFIPQQTIDDARAAAAGVADTKTEIADLRQSVIDLTGHLKGMENLNVAAIKLWSRVEKHLQEFEAKMSAQLDALTAQTQSNTKVIAGLTALAQSQGTELANRAATIASLQAAVDAGKAELDAVQANVTQLAADDAAGQAVLDAAAAAATGNNA